MRYAKIVLLCKRYGKSERYDGARQKSDGACDGSGKMPRRPPMPRAAMRRVTQMRDTHEQKDRKERRRCREQRCKDEKDAYYYCLQDATDKDDLLLTIDY